MTHVRATAVMLTLMADALPVSDAAPSALAIVTDAAPAIDAPADAVLVAPAGTRENFAEKHARQVAQWRPFDDPPADAFAIDTARGPAIVGYSPVPYRSLNASVVSAMRNEVARMRLVPGPDGKGTLFVCNMYRALLTEEEEVERFPYLRQVIDIEDLGPGALADYALAVAQTAIRLKVTRALSFCLPVPPALQARAGAGAWALMSFDSIRFMDVVGERHAPMAASIEVMVLLVPRLVRHLASFRAPPPEEGVRLEVSAAATPALMTPAPASTEAAWIMLSKVLAWSCAIHLDAPGFCALGKADAARAKKRLQKKVDEHAKLFARYIRLVMPAPAPGPS